MSASAPPPPYEEADSRNPFSANVKKLASQPLDTDQKEFLRKFILALALQWITISVVVLLFNWSKPLGEWGSGHLWIGIVCGVASAACIGAFLYFGQIRKTLVLFSAWAIVFTLSLAMFFGILVAKISSNLLVYGILMTTVVWMAQTAFAYQTKFKFTAFRGFALTLALIIVILLITGFILGWLTVGIASAMALIVSWGVYVYALKLVEKETSSTGSAA